MIAIALLRFVARTRWSSVMALVGIALGVTSIVAVHLVSQVVATQLDVLVPAPLKQFNYAASRDDLDAGQYFDVRRDWHRGVLPQGIVRLTPVIDERTVVAQHSVRVLGLDLLSADNAAALLQQVDGAETGSSPEAMADFLSGVWYSSNLGEAVREQLNREVNGYLTIDDLIIADIAVAQEILGWGQSGRLSYLGLDIELATTVAAEWLERFAPGASAGLPEVAPPQLRGYLMSPVMRQNPAQQFGYSVLFNISALGGLALVVAWFLIYQVAVSWLRRLSPIFRRLFVLGVGYLEISLYFLALMCVLGLVGAMLGLLLGSVLADWLLGLSLVEVDSPPLDRWVFIKATVSALGVSLLGGAWAFWQSTRPVSQPRWMNLTVLVVIATLILVGVLVPATALAGAFLSIALLSILMLLLMTPLVTFLRSRAGWVRGNLLLRMSVRDSVWYPRDLAVALSGLTLAIATAIGVGLMIESFRSDFTDMLDRRLSYAVSVEGASGDLQQFADETTNEPDITRLQTYRVADLRIRDVPVRLTLTHVDEYEAARYGFSRGLEADEALIGEQTARALQVEVGSTVMIAGVEYSIAGVFQSFGDLVPRLIVHEQPRDVDFSLAEIRMHLTDGALRKFQQRHPHLDWQMQATLRKVALETFDRTFAITSVLITIAIIVAGIGIYIAVTVMRLNQQASVRLLTSLGIEARELFLIDFMRGLSIGLVAVALAAPLGVAFGWLLCNVVNPRAFGWTIGLQLDFVSFLLPAVWGLAAAGFAGVLRVGLKETGFASR